MLNREVDCVLTGVPYPVTASQPGSAGKPVVLHPAELPLTISLNARNPPAYSHGYCEMSASNMILRLREHASTHVQEAHRRLPCCDEGIVHEGEDRRSCGRSSARAVNRYQRSVPDGTEVLTLGCDVRDSASTGVVEAGVISTYVREIFGHGGVLVGWSWEVVRKPPAGGERNREARVICGDYRESAGRPPITCTAANARLYILDTNTVMRSRQSKTRKNQWQYWAFAGGPNMEGMNTYLPVRNSL